MPTITSSPRWISLLAFLFVGVLWLVLPYIFSTQLIETETTLRYCVLALLLLLVSPLLFLFSFSQQGRFSLPISPLSYSLILAAYLLLAAYAVAHSLNPGEAIYEWLKLPLLVYSACVLRFLLTNKEQFLRLLAQGITIAVYSFIAISLYRQFTEHKAGILFPSLAPNYQFASSLGNKNFFAETLVLMFPFVAMLLREKNMWRWLSAVALICGFVFVLLLQSLSAWLAVGVMFVYVSISQRYWLPTLAFSTFKVAAAITIITLATVLFSTSIRQNISKRLHDISHVATKTGINEQVKSNSISERALLWRNSLKLIREKPILGWGAGNWKIYFPKFGIAGPLFTGNNTVRFVKPHNDYLLVAVEYGLIGLVLYVLLLFLPVAYAVRLLRQYPTGIDKSLLLLSSTTIIGYIIIAFFSMPGDRFYTQILFVTATTFLLSTKTSQQKLLHVTYRWRWLLAAAVAVVFSSIAWLRLQSEAHLIYALKANYKFQWTKAQLHLSAINHFYFPLDFTGTPTELHHGQALAAQQQMSFAKYNYQLGLRKNPYHLQLLNDLATTYDYDGNYQKAYEYYHKALHISPYYSIAYYNLVALEFNQGNVDTALQLLVKYPYQNQQKFQQYMETILQRKAANFFGEDTVGFNNFLLTQKGKLIPVYKQAISTKVSFESLLQK